MLRPVVNVFRYDSNYASYNNFDVLPLKLNADYVFEQCEFK